jgi:hypothetical protein
MKILPDIKENDELRFFGFGIHGLGSVWENLYSVLDLLRLYD